MALLKIHNDIVDNIASGNVNALTLLDISAAFNPIPITILLQRLHGHLGISDIALQLFKQYFLHTFTYLAHYPAHNTFHSKSCKDPSLVLFCLAYILHLSAKLLLIIISDITCMLITHMFTYHFHNQMHKNLFRL